MDDLEPVGCSVHPCLYENHVLLSEVDCAQERIFENKAAFDDFLASFSPWRVKKWLSKNKSWRIKTRLSVRKITHQE